MFKYQSINHSFIQSSFDNSLKTVQIVPIVQLSKLSEHELLMTPPSRPPRASFSNSALKGLPKNLDIDLSSHSSHTKCVCAARFAWHLRRRVAARVVAVAAVRRVLDAAARHAATAAKSLSVSVAGGAAPSLAPPPGGGPRAPAGCVRRE